MRKSPLTDTGELGIKNGEWRRVAAHSSSVLQPSVFSLGSFTLIELLVVIVIISLLAALLAPALRSARQHAWLIFCTNNLKQISSAMEMYANDYNDYYPESQGVGTWGTTNASDGWVGWLERISPYTKSTAIYSCPGQPAFTQNPYSYFNGVRAIMVNTGAFGSVSRKDILVPEQYILSGDNDWSLPGLDTDKDNYTQDCQFSGSVSNLIAGYHCQRLNVLFADGHVKAYNSFISNEMTYSLSKPGVSW